MIADRGKVKEHHTIETEVGKQVCADEHKKIHQVGGGASEY